ncbi:MAG: TonB-dependent receptor, partial [Alphaproteobacteria bacterium]|nr:TonB-dependent receptor [Alphaproteobacteria bacterium]
QLRFESARFNDDLNQQKLGSALTLDLRASWRLRPRWNAYVAVDNATDARIAYQVDSPGIDLYAAPRRIMVGVSYEPRI